jgi:hypothetical protein
MFNPSRDQVRQFFCDCYAKRVQSTPLSALEAIAAGLIAGHPQYHELLADPARALAAEFSPEGGRVNAFLHLSMHLAVEEQLSIDQPSGIRAAHQQLLAKTGDPHRAAHALIDCLAASLEQAERSNVPPDAAAYLDCVRRRAGHNRT